MDIYILNLDNFLSEVDKNYLCSFLEDKNFKAESRKNQFCTGRFLTKYAAKYFYDVENTDIEIKNKKPVFKNSELNFNISHSKNLIAVCFDENPLGFDMEFMKPRDFESILKRYNIHTDNAKELFYRFWTEYEAKLKLQSEPESQIAFQAYDEFMFAIASSKNIDLKNNFKVYELKNNSEEILNLTNVDKNTFSKKEIFIDPNKIFEPLNFKI